MESLFQNVDCVSARPGGVNIFKKLALFALIFLLAAALAITARGWYLAEKQIETMRRESANLAVSQSVTFYSSDYEEFLAHDAETYYWQIAGNSGAIREALRSFCYSYRTNVPDWIAAAEFYTAYLRLTEYRAEHGATPELEAQFELLQPGFAVLFDWDTDEINALQEDPGILARRLQSLSGFWITPEGQAARAVFGKRNQ